MRNSALALTLALGLFCSRGSEAGSKVITRPTLVAGDVKSQGDGVIAGSKGAEWALPGGARVIAAPGAELRLIGKPQRLALGPRRNTPGYTVLLRSGQVRAVAEEGRSAIVMAGPRKTRVLLESGSLGVLADDAHVAIANTDGRASVGVGSDPLKPLAAGMLRVVDRGAGEMRPLAASPSGLSLPSLALAFGGESVPLEAPSWPAAKGASAYRLELRDAEGALVTRRETKELSLGAGWAKLKPGAYEVRLAAIDPSGLEAARPAEHKLKVIGVTLPAGAMRGDGHAVFVPPGSKIQLSRVEDVEATYGSARHFIEAPRSLELFEAEPRTVRLRLRGTSDMVNLFLLPREVRAKVEFGPTAPIWPRDPVTIRVRLEESQGTPASDLVDARPKVMVGIEPVEVPFVREGEWLVGTLAPRPGDGPWVVRVEVQDPLGANLGRNFVEVASR